MKVGVDGVLIGCWADVDGTTRILDVGTGCGLIALIMAQRAPDARIDAIDVDPQSIAEALDNIAASPWPERIRAMELSFSESVSLMSGRDSGFDLIVSNPPYFDSGVTMRVTAREKARHQGELSPLSLLSGARGLLRSGGKVAMVVPADISEALETEAGRIGFRLMRKCLVRGHAGVPFKRSLLQWRLGPQAQNDIVSEINPETLTLELAPGVPTDDYRRLCKDFYLRF